MTILKSPEQVGFFVCVFLTDKKFGDCARWGGFIYGHNKSISQLWYIGANENIITIIPRVINKALPNGGAFWVYPSEVISEKVIGISLLNG